MSTNLKYRFVESALEPGMILAGRNEAPDARYARAIRACLGSYTNHNGLFINDRNHWFVGEAVKPRSRLTTLAEYEDAMNRLNYRVRVWKVTAANDDAKDFVSCYFRTHLLGLKYANHSIAKLAVFRFVNNVPWKMHIHGVWCTELVSKAWGMTPFDPFLKPENGKPKNNPTPRTPENRLVAGVLTDVTDQVLECRSV